MGVVVVLVVVWRGFIVGLGTAGGCSWMLEVLGEGTLAGDMFAWRVELGLEIIMWIEMLM